MRVKCPHCGNKFDIPIRTVLAEAERLKEIRAGRPAGAADPDAPDADGNVLPPDNTGDVKPRRS